LIETGITALDILINAKHEIAKAEKIGFSCDIRLNPDIPIDMMDIVRVLGNALDNAIEACSKVENRNRAVSLCILESKSQLIITIENTSGHYEQNESDGPHQTSKIHKLKHGFGLKTIEKIAKEYGGYISTDFSNGQFTLSVFMWKSRKPE
jgi:sensor histidine kinase regulating citrate/malate metabolism